MCDRSGRLIVEGMFYRGRIGLWIRACLSADVLVERLLSIGESTRYFCLPGDGNSTAIMESFAHRQDKFVLFKYTPRGTGRLLMACDMRIRNSTGQRCVPRHFRVRVAFTCRNGLYERTDVMATSARRLQMAIPHDVIGSLNPAGLALDRCICGVCGHLQRAHYGPTHLENVVDSRGEYRAPRL